MSDDEKNIMIGDLLVRSGLISSADLTEAMQVSRRLGMPMGRVLTMDGRISPDIFQLALEAQSIIRDGVVPPDVGIEALSIAARDRQPIAEALKRMDRHPQASASTNRLGELLVDAYIITNDQLSQALKISVETGLPLGGTLVTQGIIHASLLPTVLRAQEQIRDGVLPRDAAIEELKAAMKIWAKAEAAMKRSDYAVEQPLKPSSVMSTLRDTLEGVAQPLPLPQQQQQYQTPAPMPMPVPAPPQHQASSLHAQLQQQQQQFYQQQQQQQQQPPYPQPHPNQHQQTQPMQMPQPMQQPMPQQMPAPIYGYNTPYGHAPYGGPTPDDPWGSWHGTVPRHQGLGVPLPGFPQPPAMPPEGYSPPPSYPPQQGQHMPPPQQHWNAPPANMPAPAQHMQPQPSNLHAQLQQQQQQNSPQPQYQQPQVQTVAQYAAPAAPPAPAVSPPQSQPSQPHMQNSVQHSAPLALNDTAQHTRPDAAKQLQAAPPDDSTKDSGGQLKNAAAQLASRLGWAAPKGGDREAHAELPSPKKLSWTHPQPAAQEPQAEVEQEPTPSEHQPTAVPEPVSQSKPEPIAPPMPEPVAPSKSEPAPASAPAPTPVAETPKPAQSDFKRSSIGDYKPDWSSPSSAPPSGTPSSGAASTPSSEIKNPFAPPGASPFAAPKGVSPPSPLTKQEESVASTPPLAKVAEPVTETPPCAAAPAAQPQPKLEIAPELPVEKAVEQPQDDEPDFKLEIDLELPAAFDTQPGKPVEILAKETVLPPVETARPGQVAGFGKGTKISLKSDYAPNETGRLFSITQAEALTLLAEDASIEVVDDKKDSAPTKGKKGKGKASQSQTKLAKQTKGKKGQAAKSQSGLQSIKESEPLPTWLPQKNQTHPAAMLGKRGGGTAVPDFIEDLLPAVQHGGDVSMQYGELNQSAPGHASRPSNTQSKMASIKQRAVSVSVSNLLPVPLEIAEAQAELAYIVEHRGASAPPPVSFTMPPAAPAQPETPATIVELLTLSGFFNKKDIATALDKALEDSSLAPDLLMALGLVADDTLDVAVRCQTLVRNRYLSTEQAIYVLGAVRSGRLSFEDALLEIGK